MGVKFEITKEPDMNRTIKKIVKFQPPCTMELMALMDCFKVRHSPLRSADPCVLAHHAYCM